MWRHKVVLSRKACWLGGLALTVIGVMLPVSISSSSSASTSSPLGTGVGTVALGDVACVTSSDCWAVGDRSFGNRESTSSESLIEHWTGHAWAVVKAPRVGSSSYLAGVSCTSAVNCWAVGAAVTLATGDTGLIDHWQGRVWLQVPVSRLGAADLDGVACADSSRCWAVGDSDSGRAIIATWDGQKWADATTPVGGLVNALRSVTCPGPKTCWAVGTSLSNKKLYVPLAFRWNGGKWVVTNGLRGTLLSDVNCFSASNCWIVGATSSLRPVVQHWNGVNWTKTETPHVLGGDPLISVACAEATTCFAVGKAGQKALMERWDGRSWRIVPTPLLTGRGGFAAIRCFKNHGCWAVGGFIGDTLAPLVEYWSGSKWHILSV